MRGNILVLGAILGSGNKEPEVFPEVITIALDMDNGIIVTRFLKVFDPKEAVDAYWCGVADACSAIGIDFDESICNEPILERPEDDIIFQ